MIPVSSLVKGLSHMHKIFLVLSFQETQVSYKLPLYSLISVVQFILSPETLLSYVVTMCYFGLANKNYNSCFGHLLFLK